VLQVSVVVPVAVVVEAREVTAVAVVAAVVAWVYDLRYTLLILQFSFQILND
jgi:hypothetical protein